MHAEPLETLTQTRWDAVVIGAGPAGACAAHQLAGAGLATLLLDRGEHPRWKVCGGCLNTLGIQALVRAGLDDVLEQDCPAITHTVLRCGKRSMRTGMGLMRAVSREALDSRLIDRAISNGAIFRPGIAAHIQRTAPGDAQVSLRSGTETVELRCAAIVDASGLSTEKSASPRNGSWIGLGQTTTQPHPAEPHVLTMAVGVGGYLGRIQLGDGRINWAAAIDPKASRHLGGTEPLLRSIWSSTGGDPSELPSGPWRGTPRLTQRRSAQEGALFRIGDASGYVEPITGEGMSWAIASGIACAPSVIACARGSSGPDWARAQHRLLANRRRRCALVARGLRSTPLVQCALACAAVAPSLAGVALRWSVENRRGAFA